MNMMNNETIKRFQLSAFAFFAFTNVFAIVGFILRFWDIEIVPSEFFGGGEFGAVLFNLILLITTLNAYIILCIIAANRATRNIVMITAFIMFVVGLLRNIVPLVFSEIPVSNIFATLTRSSLYLLSSLVVLYMFGGIERNNPNCKQAQKAMLTMFWICTILPMFMNHLMVYLITESYALYNLYHIFLQLVSLGGFYFLATSSVFAGRTDNNPAPQGAYKIWNRYFKYYLLSYLLIIVVTILGIIVTEVL